MERLINRRIFFQLASAGVAGCFISPRDLFPAAGGFQLQAQTLNTARNVIFVLLPGAPSQVDTLDLKVGPWTPANFLPTTINGADFPAGLLPSLASQFNHLAIVRSCQSTALVHNLLQAWTQIARNPASPGGGIAPNIGSIVALEFEPQRNASQRLPGFLSLNGGGSLVGSGYLPGRYAPFDVTPGAGGIAALQHPDGQASFTDRYNVLQALNAAGARRVDFEELNDFYSGARSMMYDPVITETFRFTAVDQTKYGNSPFGNACIVARNLINANLGTRYIQITLGGWDNHSNIYLANAGIYRSAMQLDAGLGNLIADLSVLPGANGGTRLDETLIVVKGEFGRTVGNVNTQQGRDHFSLHATLFAGGGVRGGQVLGATTADGRFVERPGWSQERPVSPEDVAATIYSALGIDYTTVRRDAPLGRGFEYVPSNGQWPAYPIAELFR